MPKKNTSNKPVKTLFEKINKDKLLRLMSSIHLTIEEKNALFRYKQKLLNGFVPVNYYFSDIGLGRLYAGGGLSLQSFSKKIRHTLAKDDYDDIDMVNAHPVFLVQYCDKNNIEYNLLRNYVQNREKWLADIMDFHGCSRNCSKNLVLRLCYLGNYEIINDDDDDDEKRCCVCHNFQKTYIINDGDVCEKCRDEAIRRIDGSDFLLDSYIELNLIDMFNERTDMNVCINTTVSILNDLNNLFFPTNCDKKLDKLVKFADELKNIANKVYKIEKELVNIVEKNDNGKNKKSRVLALTLQSLEHKCLMHMYDFFESNALRVGVYVFDGFMVEKNPKKSVSDDLLRNCECYIKKKTGYQINLDIKPMDMGLNLPKISEFVEDDKDVQEKLFILENPDYFKYCNEQMYVFSEITGKYDTNESSIDYYIIKHQQYFCKETIISEKRSILKNYGRDDSLISKVRRFIKVASRDDDWVDNTAHTSLGYLLFKDGIYNMKTNTFEKNFDPTIVFHNHIPHNFPERNEDDVKYAANISFNLMFSDPLPLIVLFARALTGEGLKKFPFCPGKTDAGKSILIKMFKYCFGDYIGAFNVDDLANKKNDSREEAQKYRWALLLRFKRIIFSSEANMDSILNGNYIKKISGGDAIPGRTLFKEDQTFTPHFTAFCMLNDIPKIEPTDDAVYNRLEYCEFEKQFVVNPTEKYHIKADPDIEKKIRDPRFIRGFIHLILDGYVYFLEHGQPPFDIRSKEEWTIDGRKDTNIAELLSNNFEITNNKDDFITITDMNKFRNKFKKEFLNISNKRFNELVNLTFKITQTKKGKNNIRGWIGIKQKEEILKFN